LLLRVFPDSTNEKDPWTWKVLALDDEAEREIEVGGGVTREASMASALAAAYGE
jgi:hypothetical protein